MNELLNQPTPRANAPLVLLSLVALCFAVLWLYERFQPPAILEQPVPKRVEVLKVVPFEKVREIPVEKIKEVVKEVPAQLTDAQKEALEFSSNYVAAPRLSGMDDALYKLDTVRVEVNLKPAIEQAVPADQLKNYYEQALRRNGVQLDSDSAYLLGINYDGFWIENENRFVYGVYLELYDSVTIERQGDLRRTYAIVWVHNYLGSGLANDARQLILSNAETNAVVFGRKWSSIQERNR
jgi:hypothetical protein